MENTPENYKHIKGWGVDANDANEPTYPMKKYTGDDHKRLDYEKAPQQPETVEILHSNERPDLTAVFGTSAPPSGLSGAIRRFAFKYSESSYGHWLPLLFADRINMVEGIIDDLVHGHIPNIIAEKGLPAEWKYNKKEFTQRLLITAGITLAAVAFLSRKKKPDYKKLVRKRLL